MRAFETKFNSFKAFVCTTSSSSASTASVLYLVVVVGVVTPLNSCSIADEKSVYSICESNLQNCHPRAQIRGAGEAGAGGRQQWRVTGSEDPPASHRTVVV